MKFGITTCIVIVSILLKVFPRLSFSLGFRQSKTLHLQKNYHRSRLTMTISLNNVKVTTYNVLSTHLGGADYYRACNPKWLDSNHRLRKLKEKLDIETNSNSIICLQEVSNQCASILHPYFLKKNYYFLTAHYGNKFNNYMGVGIAVPLSSYNIEDMDITRVADTKKVIRQPVDSKVVKLLKDFLISPFMNLLRSLGILKKVFKPWDDALKRMNQMICVRLSPKNSNNNNNSFVVGTYHMPCMFDYPTVMMTHCSLSAQHIQRYANNDPFIFTGDFNIKPTDSMYELLTKGCVDKSNPYIPDKLSEDDDWQVDVQPMRSAYVLKNKCEPEFTNYAKVKDDPPFIGTLDYIFLSSHWKVNRVKTLSPLQGYEGPLPTENEPSDHLLLSADISL